MKIAQPEDIPDQVPRKERIHAFEELGRANRKWEYGTHLDVEGVACRKIHEPTRSEIRVGAAEGPENVDRGGALVHGYFVVGVGLIEPDPHVFFFPNDARGANHQPNSAAGRPSVPRQASRLKIMPWPIDGPDRVDEELDSMAIAMIRDGVNALRSRRA